MAAKVKGFFKGFKHISQIFVVKEHEMEIGNPTDVKHVAHIGWENGSSYEPSWMNKYVASSDFSSSLINSFGPSREASCASQEFDQRRGRRSSRRGIRESGLQTGTPKTPSKKMRRKKSKALSPSSSRSQEGHQDRDHKTTTILEEIRLNCFLL